MDVSDGNPCNPVDASATHMVGDTYKVAVCLTSAGVSDNGKNGPPASFQFDLDYDKTLNQCIDPAVLCTDDASTDAHCLDGDPDVNAGTTTFGGTSLGAGWDCTASQTTRPYCDTGNGTGNEAIAQAVCYTTKTPTLATGDTVSSAIAEVTFKALKVGTDTLALNNVTEGDAAGLEPIICPPSNQGDWVRCLNGTDIKAVPTATFTPTSTATPTVTNTPVPATATFTPTATFTSTPVPAGVRMQKLISPADTTNNGVLWVTKAGCWKIDPATGKPATDPITNQPIIDPTIAAANNGKGCLVIDEKIFGIHDLCNPNNVNAQGTPEAPGCSTPEGLGAWEHLLTFDHNFVYVQTSPERRAPRLAHQRWPPRQLQRCRWLLRHHPERELDSRGLRDQGRPEQPGPTWT